MKFSVVTAHVPEREGVAPGRVTRAACTGLVELGHDLELWTWNRDEPEESLPTWCRWEPLPDGDRLRAKLAGVRRPRSDVLRAGWSPPSDAIALADEASSFPAVSASRRSVLLIHQLARLDLRALGGLPSGADIQKLRAQQRAIRRAQLVLCTSPRVAAAIGAPNAVVVPITHELGEQLPVVDAPVAGLLANWRWPPNAWALDVLLRAWPEVRARVPAARLILGGHGLPDIGPLAGVEVVGRVAHSEEVLARIGVLAFPCPASSGPKIKVLEAIGRGVPAVTTAAGVEGLTLSDESGAVVTTAPGFVTSLVELLKDPERRASLAHRGRTDILRHHAPKPAAARWADACRVLIEDEPAD